MYDKDDGLHDAALAELALPGPCGAHGVGQRGVGFPAEDFVGVRGVAPHFLNVACAAGCDAVGHLHAGGFLKGVDELEDAHAVARAEVVDFDGGCVGTFEHAVHGLDVGLGEVNNVDEVADAGAVGCGIVVAEHAEFLADAHGCLGDVRDEILGHAVGELADFGRGMCTYGVEVAEYDALEGCAGVDDVGDDFLADLFGVAIGRGGLLDGALLGNGVHVGLAVDGAG